LVFGEALRRLRLLLCWKLVFGEALRRLRLLLCVGTYILRRECMACAWIFLLDMELSTVSRLLGFGVQNTGESPVLRGVFRHDKGYLGPGVHGVHLDLHARREALDGGSATLSDRSFPRWCLLHSCYLFLCVYLVGRWAYTQQKVCGLCRTALCHICLAKVNVWSHS